MKRLFKILLLACFVVGLLCLWGCQSTDKTQSYMTTGGISRTASFDYDNSRNETFIVWETTLENKTIYDFYSFKVTFELFSYGESLGEKTYTYEIGAKQGQSYTGRFNFYADGEVTDIEYVSWRAIYRSAWDTYKALFIIAIIFVLLSVLVYGYVVFKKDLELASFDFDDFKEAGAHFAIAPFFVLPMLCTLGSLFTGNWVYPLVFIGCIIVVAIMMFVVHCTHCFVKGFIEGCNSGKPSKVPYVVFEPIVTQKPDIYKRVEDSVDVKRIEDTVSGGIDSTDTTTGDTYYKKSTK